MSGPKSDQWRYVFLDEQGRQRTRFESVPPELLAERMREAFATDDHARLAALAETVVPAEVWTEAFRPGGLALRLDEQTAQVPWELLRPTALVGVPLVAATEVIRSFGAWTPAEPASPRVSNTALIIGAPPLFDIVPTQPLPSARITGDVVAVLSQHIEDLAVLTGDHATPAAIQRELRSKVPPRILHFVGDGILASDRVPGRPPRLAIGDHLIAIRKGVTRQSPELVFLDICHRNDLESEAFRSFPFTEFAARLASDLLEAGVRAVIITGWPVDESVSRQFATTLYERMLRFGNRFGDAISFARRNARLVETTPTAAGALQCYGDATFTLTDRQPGDVVRA